MKKIGTHNSATGESGHGILSWLGTPFARCQSKTIAEQYNAGCRYFDIRIKETKRGWVCAHGIWQSRKSVHDILHEIDAYNDCYVMLTYEGQASDDFIDMTDTFVSTYTDFKEGIEKKIHTAGAVLCLVFSQVWVALTCPWVLLVWVGYLVYTAIGIKRNWTGYFIGSFMATKPMFWLEITSLLTTYVTLLIV